MMKLLALFALLTCGAAVESQKGTITKVVNLLQDMLDKSKKEGDEERVIYARFKCYCDTSEADKKASIDKLTEQIALLESDIEKLQGSTGVLSSECADLKTKLAENEQARDEADALREKENKAFTAEEADLKQAISQMENAIDTLTKVGADQTSATGADNKQFMAGHKGSLLSLNTQMQSALRAASALMSPTQQSTATAFLQSPFTGTYTSQSGQVMGIIKNMRDTFIANLDDARVTEKNALEAFDKFIAIKEKAHGEMSDSYEEKQKSLGGNDGDLSSKKGQLSEAKKQKGSDEEFLDSLLPMCKDKAEAYSTRKLLRANEEAAIAEAISILNSDDAFATFGTTSATKTGGLKFIQLHSEASNVNTATSVLQKAAKATKSARLSKVLAKLQAENPFDGVLEEIDKMITLIGEEAKADKKNLDWCNSERDENEATKKKKISEINGLNEEIDKLDKLINDKEKGLLAQIEDTEDSLVKNNEAQKSETVDRTEDNMAYQQDVKNLVAANSILSKAIKVLKAYYDDLAEKLEAGEAFVQTKEDPKPPESFDNKGYGGQSEQGGDVINMLTFIAEETTKEEMKAHSDEEKAQADYEDSMTSLKKLQKEAEESLADLKEKLATAQKDKLEAEEDLKDTTKDKEAIETYLAKIKPGCDFITKNFDLREKNRGIEETALKKAIGLIKATPAYTTAKAAEKVEGYGDCKETCKKDDKDVECLACMADVTIPAYCAGHADAKGC